ncbi:MAG: HAD family hydrolase [Lachnospiraceae bacterium]
MEKQIEAVIFDIDGTMVNSMMLWSEIDVEYFDRIGIPMPATLQKDIEGMSFTDTAVYFKKTFHLENKTVEDIKNDWIEMAHEKYLYEIRTKPGITEYIDFLKAHGIKIGVATSNDKTLAVAALEAHGLYEKVDVLRTACEVPKGKPAPDIYLKVAEDLGVSPQNCLVFEDIPNGIRAGKSAGMTVIAVEDDFSMKYYDEKIALSDGYVKDFHEVFMGNIEVNYGISSDQ